MRHRTVQPSWPVSWRSSGKLQPGGWLDGAGVAGRLRPSGWLAGAGVAGEAKARARWLAGWLIYWFMGSCHRLRGTLQSLVLLLDVCCASPLQAAPRTGPGLNTAGCTTCASPPHCRLHHDLAQASTLHAAPPHCRLHHDLAQARALAAASRQREALLEARVAQLEELLAEREDRVAQLEVGGWVWWAALLVMWLMVGVGHVVDGGGRPCG